MSSDRRHTAARDGNPELETGRRVSTIQIDTPTENVPFPRFNKPSVRGTFSLTAGRIYVEGPECLKFFQMPASGNVHFDLDELTRRTRAEAADETESGDDMHSQTNELVHLLHWIHTHEESFMKRKPHFVCYRGLMTKLLGTPYERRESWRLGAMLKNGTIYLRNIDTPESLADRERQRTDERQRKMTSWGYNFEQFLLSDGPLSKPDPTFLRKDECNFVFQTKLGSHDLLYAAEIDGVWLPDGSDMNPKLHPQLIDTCRLVELKTTRLFEDGQMTHNFRRFNLRKWFCQSFTVGISHVIGGLRDDEGVVHKLKVFPVESLAKEGKEWLPTVCFNFLDRFLSQVMQSIHSDESSVYIFEYQPRSSNRFVSTISISSEPVSHSALYLPDIR